MSYYGFCITDEGRDLITKLVAGQTLAISNVLVGSGVLDDTAIPAEQTALVQPVARATSTIPTYDGATLRMTIEYRSDMNGGIDEGFWLNEFGVLAQDPDKGEILLYYGSLGDYPQYVSAGTSTGVDVRRFPICVAVNQDVNIEIDYNCEAWMTADDVAEYCTSTVLPEFLDEAQKLIDTHNDDREAHSAIRGTISVLDARVTLLELLFNTNVTGNPFTITFESLDGTTTAGVWNTSASRIEF